MIPAKKDSQGENSPNNLESETATNDLTSMSFRSKSQNGTTEDVLKDNKSREIEATKINIHAFDFISESEKVVSRDMSVVENPTNIKETSDDILSISKSVSASNGAIPGKISSGEKSKIPPAGKKIDSDEAAKMKCAVVCRSNCTFSSRNIRQSQKQLREIIGKQEQKNEKLHQLEGMMRERNELLDCVLPATVLCMLLCKVGEQPMSSIYRIFEELLQSSNFNSLTVPCLPSQHYNCQIHRIKSERKQAEHRVEEARALWAQKKEALKELQQTLEKARKLRQEREERIQVLSNEVMQAKSALDKAKEGDSCEAGECGVLMCRKLWLGESVSETSMKSTDLESIIKLQKLVQERLYMKRCIADLERREELYMQTVEQVDQRFSQISDKETIIPIKAMDLDTTDKRSEVDEDVITKIRTANSDTHDMTESVDKGVNREIQLTQEFISTESDVDEDEFSDLSVEYPVCPEGYTCGESDGDLQEGKPCPSNIEYRADREFDKAKFEFPNPLILNVSENKSQKRKIHSNTREVNQSKMLSLNKSIESTSRKIMKEKSKRSIEPVRGVHQKTQIIYTKDKRTQNVVNRTKETEVSTVSSKNSITTMQDCVRKVEDCVVIPHKELTSWLYMVKEIHSLISECANCCIALSNTSKIEKEISSHLGVKNGKNETVSAVVTADAFGSIEKVLNERVNNIAKRTKLDFKGSSTQSVKKAKRMMKEKETFIADGGTVKDEFNEQVNVKAVSVIKDIDIKNELHKFYEDLLQVNKKTELIGINRALALQDDWKKDVIQVASDTERVEMSEEKLPEEVVWKTTLSSNLEVKSTRLTDIPVRLESVQVQATSNSSKFYEKQNDSASQKTASSSYNVNEEMSKKTSNINKFSQEREFPELNEITKKVEGSVSCADKYEYDKEVPTVSTNLKKLELPETEKISTKILRKSVPSINTDEQVNSLSTISNHLKIKQTEINCDPVHPKRISETKNLVRKREHFESDEISGKVERKSIPSMDDEEQVLKLSIINNNIQKHELLETEEIPTKIIKRTFPSTKEDNQGRSLSIVSSKELLFREDTGDEHSLRKTGNKDKRLSLTKADQISRTYTASITSVNDQIRHSHELTRRMFMKKEVEKVLGKYSDKRSMSKELNPTYDSHSLSNKHSVSKSSMSYKKIEVDETPVKESCAYTEKERPYSIKRVIGANNSPLHESILRKIIKDFANKDSPSIVTICQRPKNKCKCVSSTSQIDTTLFSSKVCNELKAKPPPLLPPKSKLTEDVLCSETSANLVTCILNQKSEQESSKLPSNSHRKSTVTQSLSNSQNTETTLTVCNNCRSEVPKPKEEIKYIIIENFQKKNICSCKEESLHTFQALSTQSSNDKNHSVKPPKTGTIPKTQSTCTMSNSNSFANGRFDGE